MSSSSFYCHSGPGQFAYGFSANTPQPQPSYVQPSPQQYQQHYPPPSGHVQHHQQDSPYYAPPPQGVSYGPPPPMGAHYGAPPPQRPEPQQQRGYGSMSAKKGSSRSLKKQLLNFFVDQEVEVQIQGNRWVIGIVIGVLEFIHKLAGYGYTVRYRTGSEERVESFLADEDHMRARGL